MKYYTYILSFASWSELFINIIKRDIFFFQFFIVAPSVLSCKKHRTKGWCVNCRRRFKTFLPPEIIQAALNSVAFFVFTINPLRTIRLRNRGSHVGIVGYGLDDRGTMIQIP